MDVHAALPIIGTAALAAGLLMPLRDGRRGRRATLSGQGPLLPRFALDAVSVESPVDDAMPPSECTPASEVPHTAYEPHSEALLETTQRIVPVGIPDGNRSRPTADSLALNVSTAPTAVMVRFSPLETEAATAPAEIAEAPCGAMTQSPTAEVAQTRLEPSVDPQLPTRTTGRGRDRLVRVCRWLVRWSDDDVPSSQKRSAGVVDAADAADFAAAVSGATDGADSSSSSVQHVALPVEGTTDSPIVDAPEPPPNVTLRVQRNTAAVIPIAAARSGETHQDEVRDVAVAQRAPAIRVAGTVPLTRLPLRHVSHEIAWYHNLPAPLEATDDVGRLAALSTIARSATITIPVEALVTAYSEESGDHRVMVLRALARSRSPVALETLQHALVMGTDDERVLALDALAIIGRSDLVRPALDDRLDTIVARASLALCPSRRRNDHAQLLDEYLEPARRDSVLLLLAGVLE